MVALLVTLHDDCACLWLQGTNMSPFRKSTPDGAVACYEQATSQDTKY